MPVEQGWIVLGLTVGLFLLLGAFALAGRPRHRSPGG
jgi:hypothetical protein